VFQEQKAAQVAAYFLSKEGGRMAHLKLMKLMYLAEREAMRRHGFPMTGDRFVSMPHGPVLTMALNHIDGDVESSPDGWDSWVSDKANHCVEVIRRVDRDALDELSDVDLEVLEHVWQSFGHMNKWQLRDFTHDPENCPEWRDPNGSSLPITYAKVLRAVGYGAKEAAELAAEIDAQDRMSRLLSA
jgi:uncharacterized phage-associated protein